MTGAAGAGKLDTDGVAEGHPDIECGEGSEDEADKRKGSRRCGAGGVRVDGAEDNDGVV